MRRSSVLLAVLLSSAAPALPWRDPLQPPPQAAAAAPAPSATQAAAAGFEPAPLPAVRHIVTVEGVRYVVVGARRLAVGERWGAGRIECIDERGVLVRDAAQTLRHLPLLASVPAAAGAAPKCLQPAPPGAPAAKAAAQRAAKTSTKPATHKATRTAPEIATETAAQTAMRNPP